MLNKVKTLNGYSLKSLDGEIGKVKDFYFDDRYWTIRYLVADTGNWLTGRQVLLSPYALGAVIKEQHDITIDLTKKQIENSPSLNSDKPVSKQFEISKEFEISYFGYYGYPSYWSGSNMWGAYPYIQRNPELTTEFNREKQSWDYHLRSTHEVIGYHIQATDGEIGHIEDFIVDDETWTIRYLIIDTANWWSGKKNPTFTAMDSSVLVGVSRKSLLPILARPSSDRQNIRMSLYSLWITRLNCIFITTVKDTG